MASLDPGVQIGDFQIIKLLGVGGMGIVYLAKQISLDRLVALKLLGNALTDRSDIARFHREAQAIAKLNNPGIASVYYVGQDRRVCYLAMEYIDGISLRDVINRLSKLGEAGHSIDKIVRSISANAVEATEARFDEETLSYTTQPCPGDGLVKPDSLTPEAEQLINTTEHIRRVCLIVKDVAMVLAHAHERGVVHRDIKPENVLLDKEGRSHIIDFGIARFFEDVTLTSTGALIGTPMYMPPEQVSGRLKIDHRADIYSLGLMLYELLTLRRPISDQTREGVLRQIVTKALPPVSRRNRSIPRELESVVHKATAKDPDERYQSASDFAADLLNVVESRPVAAPYYRYKFDEREIVAQRPPSVTIIGFSIQVMGLFVLVGAGVMFLEKLSDAGRVASRLGIPNSVPITLLTLGLITLLSANRLLSGRKWAIPILMPLCVVFALLPFPAVGEMTGLTFGQNSIWLKGWAALAFFALLNIVIFIGFIGMIFLLNQARARQWLNFATRLRSEHLHAATTR
jgi:serine/threonine protein kinase